MNQSPSDRWDSSREGGVSRQPRVYLAGPEVFLPEPMVQATWKKDLCRRFGFEGVFPLDANVNVDSKTQENIAREISVGNENLIRGCDLLIANITPFRGPSADVGTAYEMGFARGLGLPVFAYTNSREKFTERTVRALDSEVQQNADGTLRDVNTMEIEQWGLVDNLMLDGCVHWSGGVLVVGDTTESELYTGLDAFHECLREARRFWDSRSCGR